eukprot:gnl/Dysnectes_brevis/3615_a4602_876.p1 GENE.gnl/Dysnectes_brevis/3615_a4602_876~~gnl/Dysnectes_brevis/3615_a4602_876.p1  ORF type:complete len:213 (+),score=0.49 gnl/Dysnectes_brevis/3615_a4602_876:48-686(+)
MPRGRGRSGRSRPSKRRSRSRPKRRRSNRSRTHTRSNRNTRTRSNRNTSRSHYRSHYKTSTDTQPISPAETYCIIVTLLLVFGAPFLVALPCVIFMFINEDLMMIGVIVGLVLMVLSICAAVRGYQRRKATEAQQALKTMPSDAPSYPAQTYGPPGAAITLQAVPLHDPTSPPLPVAPMQPPVAPMQTAVAPPGVIQDSQPVDYSYNPAGML